jgi:hypothetical protein
MELVKLSLKQRCALGREMVLLFGTGLPTRKYRKLADIVTCAVNEVLVSESDKPLCKLSMAVHTAIARVGKRTHTGLSYVLRTNGDAKFFSRDAAMALEVSYNHKSISDVARKFNISSNTVRNRLVLVITILTDYHKDLKEKR